MNEVALKILKKINNSGYVSYLVGGYPRDIILGRDSVDFDICTSATPKELKDIFGDLILPSEQYGSVTLVLNNTHFEITTFRKEIKYLNNRKPIEIEYIKDLTEDLKRRDFVMNTLCIDEFGNIIDLLNAKEDIYNKIIHTVGNSDEKIREDSLRILRAIRFATTLNFKLSEELCNSIKKYAYLVKELSYFRKKQELDKIFASKNIKYGIELLDSLGLAQYLELYNIKNVVPTTYLIGIWSQLNVLNKYNFNNVEKDSIIKINELANKELTDNNIYKYGLYISTIVAEIKGIDKNKITEIYNNLYIHNKTEINITANEICGLLNKKSGPYLKNIIADLEEQLINKNIKNNSQDLIDYVLYNYGGKDIF